MKNIIIPALLMLFVFIFNGDVLAQKNKKKRNKNKNETEQVEFKSFTDTISYIIGRDLGRNLSIIHEDLNLELLSVALRESFNGKEGMFAQEVSDSLIQVFQNRLVENENSNSKEMIETNRKAGEDFLKKNGERPEIIHLDGGLQLEVITDGDGLSPEATDKVTVHYKGTLIDGSVFDSSYERGEPISFALNGVIKGWTDGLQEMKTGGKYILYIPPELGYGNRDLGVIPPGSTLIFEIELLGIE